MLQKIQMLYGENEGLLISKNPVCRTSLWLTEEEPHWRTPWKRSSSPVDSTCVSEKQKLARRHRGIGSISQLPSPNQTARKKKSKRKVIALQSQNLCCKTLLRSHCGKSWLICTNLTIWKPVKVVWKLSQISYYHLSAICTITVTPFCNFFTFVEMNQTNGRRDITRI